MATLTSLGTVSVTGVKYTGLVAAAAAGDDFVNEGNSLLIIKNSSVGDDRTLTIHSVQVCDTGLLEHDQTVTVTAASTFLFYAFNPKRWNSATQKVSLTYSSEADLTIGYYKIG